MDLDNIQRKYGLPAPLPVVQNRKFAPRFPLNLEHRGDDVFQFGGKYIGEIENIYDLLYKILTNQEIDASLALPYAIKITEDKLYVRDKTNSEWILIFDITKPNFPKEIELYELIYKAITHQVIGEDTSYPGQFKIEENILYVRDKDNLTWTQIGDVTKEFLGATEATQAILDQVNEILTEVQELKTELNRQIATTNETLTTALQAANEAMTSAQSINIRTFNSVEEMKASNTLKAGALAKTLGFYTAGDGGKADYVITDSIGENSIDEASIIALKNGLYANLLLKDYVNVNQFGAYGNDADDDTEAIQKAIDFIVKNTGTLVFLNKTYIVNGSLNLVKTGVANVKLIGYGAILKKTLDTEITILTVKSGVESGIYNDRIQHVVINDLTLKSVGNGEGLKLAFFGDSVKVNNVKTYSFTHGIYITEGSEFVLENCSSAGCIYGVYYGSNTTPVSDAQCVHLKNCYISNNVEANVYLENIYELYINGGSYMEVSGNNEATGGIVFGKGCGNANVVIEKVNFEQTDKPSIFAYGSHPVELLIKNNQFAPNKIDVPIVDVAVGNSLNGLKIINNYTDTNIAPLVNIRNTVNDDYDITLENNLPSKCCFRFTDNRPAVENRNYSILPKNSYLNKSWSINGKYGISSFGAYNGTAGYDTDTSITGVGKPTLSNGYVELIFNKTLPLVLDIIIKAENMDNIWQAVWCVTSTGQNSLTAILGIDNTVPIIKKFSNGFYRFMYYIPPYMSINGLRLNASANTGKLTIAYLSIYSIGKQIDNSNYYSSTSAPTVGTHYKGDIVYNSNPTASGNLGWVCITNGIPGTWKAFGSIQN